MKIKVYKKHWDKAKKKQFSDPHFSATADCLLATAIKDQMKGSTVDNVTFYRATIDGKRYASVTREATEILVSQWIHGDDEGRQKLPLTIEFEETENYLSD